MNDSELGQLYIEETRNLLALDRSMDTTRNLSVLALAGMIFVGFGFPLSSSHLVLILGSLVIFAFQLFETRAHRFASVSRLRTRAIEKNHIAPAVDRSIVPEEGWRRKLAGNLRAGSVPSGFVEAFAARTVRNYIVIFLTLDICWFTKLYLYPDPASDWSTFVGRLDTGVLPGWFFLVFAGTFWAIYLSLAVWHLIRTKGEESVY
jgi:uncharacterized membrane protein